MHLKWYTHSDAPDVRSFPRQGTGRAQRIHDALRHSLDVDFATLLVDSTHTKVQALYERWGYRKRDEAKPSDDSPVYAVMVRDL
ncbi:hypothetical protein ACIPW5_26375 [Streptomyces sp. NPDC090077]|uniref:hypothetical protein n=1 Tax=Streptomyces sp. NPDC090077 TaxID=3365938 RepID=UPI003824FFE0